MWTRSVGILLLVGTVCLGTAAADENVSSLISNARQAYKSGNYEDAERYGREAVEVAERSGDAAEFATALGDLCAVLMAKSQYDESKRLCVKALGILRNIETKRYLPVVLSTLGALSGRDGDHVQAERYLKESLRVAQELDSRDPYISIILNNLGVFYNRTRDTGRAEKAFKKAIAFIEKESGRDSAELVPILNNLGGLYVIRKKWDDAVPLFDRALRLLQDSVSGNHPYVAGVLDNVGTMHYARKDFAEAEKAFRGAYTIRLEVFGLKHPVATKTAVALADTLTAGGHYDEAERLYADALQIYEKAVGLRSLEVATILEQMAELFRKTNRTEEAIGLGERAESIHFDLEHVVRAEQLR